MVMFKIEKNNKELVLFYTGKFYEVFEDGKLILQDQDYEIARAKALNEET